MDADLNANISQLRKEYSLQTLSEESVDKNPFKQFEKWMKEVVETGAIDANAMTLSTVSHEGKPSSRIVLLKSFDQNGFTFYTNYSSSKGIDMEQNPWVSLSFFWISLERQVHIKGRASKISPKESDEYFASRPKGSQLAAWASSQSQIITNRSVLDNRYTELEKLYENKLVPRPPHWGGYLVEPFSIEFWQGRESRLHDRILYDKIATDWKISRLSP